MAGVGLQQCYLGSPAAKQPNHRDLREDRGIMSSPDRSLKMAVVGAGVIGLSTAYHLSAKYGASVTVIAERFSPDTTSDRAGGLIQPVIVDCKAQKALESDVRQQQWTRDTFEHLHSLYHSTVAAEIEMSMVSGYDFQSTTTELPWWKDMVYGFRRIPIDSHEIRKVVPPPKFHENMCAWGFSAYMLDGSRYLPWLLGKITERGGVVEQRKLSSLDELNGGDWDVVVNCTGLGAADLVNDHGNLYPVQGQLVVVRAPWIKQFVNFDSFWGDGKLMYILPRSSEVVLGGTAVRGDWSEDVDPQTSEEIVSRCATFIPSLRKAEVIRAWTGLRPMRPAVRLEKEERGPEKPLLIHNYGHGSQGLTVHWGCALEVGRIVQQSFLHANL